MWACAKKEHADSLLQSSVLFILLLIFLLPTETEHLLDADFYFIRRRLEGVRSILLPFLDLLRLQLRTCVQVCFQVLERGALACGRFLLFYGLRSSQFSFKQLNSAFDLEQPIHPSDNENDTRRI